MRSVIKIFDIEQWQKIVQSGKFRDAGLYEIGRKTVYSFTYPNGYTILKTEK